MDNNNNREVVIHTELEQFLHEWKQEIRERTASLQPPLPIIQVLSYCYPLTPLLLRAWAHEIIKPCRICMDQPRGKLLGPLQCIHVSGEELAVFWNLRLVCKQWKEEVDAWLRGLYLRVWNHVLHGHGLKIHREGYTKREIRSDNPGRKCLCYTQRYRNAIHWWLRAKLLMAGVFVHSLYIYEDNEIDYNPPPLKRKHPEEDDWASYFFSECTIC